MVHGEVCFLEDRSQLELVWSGLVVACLARDAKLEGLYLKVAHKGCHTLGNGAEVMVVHLLVLGAVVTHKRATGHQQVWACSVKAFVDEEVFLFPSEVRDNLLHIGVEELRHGSGCYVHGVERFLQRRFVVERLACVGNEHGRYHQRVADDEDG